MNTSGSRTGWWKRAGTAAALALGMMGTAAACSHGAGGSGHGGSSPRTAEFGFGPRASSAGTYHAAIEPAEELRIGRMHTVKLSIRGADGRPVDGATVEVDGGMPQHGHGLPTRPRVTASLGEGAYRVDGVRFNMGGWWELKFRITAAGATDTVTFNLNL